MPLYFARNRLIFSSTKVLRDLFNRINSIPFFSQIRQCHLSSLPSEKNRSVKYESNLRIFSRHFCIALHCRKFQQLIVAWRHCEHGHSANVSRCRRQAELLLAVAARRDSDASAFAGDTC